MPENTRTDDRLRECMCGDYDTDHEARTGYCHFNVRPQDQSLRTTGMCYGMRKVTIPWKYNRLRDANTGSRS